MLCAPGVDHTKLFFCKPITFPFFYVELGHFTVNTTLSVCYKHSNLTAKNGKQRKTKFGRIDSWKVYFFSFEAWNENVQNWIFVDTLCINKMKLLEVFFCCGIFVEIVLDKFFLWRLLWLLWEWSRDLNLGTLLNIMKCYYISLYNRLFTFNLKILQYYFRAITEK